MHYSAAALAVSCLFISFCNTPVLAKSLRALIIGNGKYEKVDPPANLIGPTRDADIISTELSKLAKKGGVKYVPTVRKNIGRIKFFRLWKTFKSQIEPGDIVVFYFSGHGIEYGAQGYLLPSDYAGLENNIPDDLVPDELRATTVPWLRFVSEVKRLQAVFEQQRKDDILTVFIIDACRDSPILGDDGTKFFGKSNIGVAGVRRETGMFLLSSAEPGQTALDHLGPKDTDKDKGSVYTRHLRHWLTRRDMSLARIAQFVRVEVSNAALNRLDKNGKPAEHPQTPSYYDGLRGNFNLLGEEIELKDKHRHVNGLRVKLGRFKQKNFRRARVASLTSQAGQRQSDRSGLKSVASRTANPVLPAECVGCPDLVVVKGGTFQMGRSDSEEAGRPFEGPPVEVSMNHSFGIAKYEVTWEQWEACRLDGKTFKHKKDRCRDLAPAYLDQKSIPIDQRPIVNVSLEDAQKFISWLNKTTGRQSAQHQYRLPSEAEWEFVARSASSTASTSKIKPVDLCLHANGADQRLPLWLFEANTACDDGYGADPAPVGSYQPNALGVYDMRGNVWEWVADCWADTLEGTPKDGSPRGGGKDCANGHTARGGSWHSLPAAMTETSRTRFTAGMRRRTLGFRVALTLEDQATN